MPSIDVTGASKRLLAYSPTQAAAECLRYNWLAVGQGRHYITGGGDNAFNTWRAIPANKRHVGDKRAPEGFQYYLGIRTSTGNALGDVVTADGTFTAFGDPYVIATDWPSAKKVGRCTLSQRIAQTGRQFLGWAESMGGWDLIRPGTSGGGDTPIPTPATAQDDGDTMRFMNRTPDNTVAIFDESHWQEIKYLASAPAGTPLGVATQYVIGLTHSLAEAPYDEYGWNNRSNLAPNLKKPVFIQNADGSLTPIPAAAGDGGSFDPTAIIAALNVLHEQIAALPAPPTQFTITGKAQA